MLEYAQIPTPLLCVYQKELFVDLLSSFFRIVVYSSINAINLWQSNVMLIYGQIFFFLTRSAEFSTWSSKTRYFFPAMISSLSVWIFFLLDINSLWIHSANNRVCDVGRLMFYVHLNQMELKIWTAFFFGSFNSFSNKSMLGNHLVFLVFAIWLTTISRHNKICHVMFPRWRAKKIYWSEILP